VSGSYELIPVDAVTAGTVGEPGNRTFFIQARKNGDQVTLLAEKGQVYVLAQALEQLLSAVPNAIIGDAPEPGALELWEPIEPEWRVGEIGLEYDEVLDLVIIIARELLDDDAEFLAAQAELLGDEDEDDDTPPALPDRPERGVARFGATRAQIRAMIERSLEVVAAGRPRCPHCGQVLPEEGAPHGCPPTNGHRKA
jgi:uncharacterized repeat protein (TIGR03847 family)